MKHTNGSSSFRIKDMGIIESSLQIDRDHDPFQESDGEDSTYYIQELQHSFNDKSLEEIIGIFDQKLEDTCGNDPLSLLESSDILQDIDVSQPGIMKVARILCHSFDSGFVRRSRFRLVPTRMSEQRFWSIIFTHFHTWKELHSSKQSDQFQRECIGEEKYIKPEDTEPVTASSKPKEDPSQTISWTSILSLRLCYLYGIPNHSMIAGVGYYANNWDLSNPIFTGKLNITVSSQNVLVIRVLDRSSDQPFAESEPISLVKIAKKEQKLETYVDPVVDSSRYFVLRIQDPISKKRGFIGLGFHDRSHSFDFNATIQDYIRRVRRQIGQLCDDKCSEKQYENIAASTGFKDTNVLDVNRTVNLYGPNDLSLKEPVRLNPLPVSKKTKLRKKKKNKCAPVKEDEWGEFESA